MKPGDMVVAHCKTATPYTFDNFLGIFLGSEEVGSYCVRYIFLTPSGLKRVVDSRRKSVNQYEVVR